MEIEKDEIKKNIKIIEKAYEILKKKLCFLQLYNRYANIIFL